MNSSKSISERASTARSSSPVRFSPAPTRSGSWTISRAGLDEVLMATPNPTADTVIIQVVPEGAPDSQETKDVVHELRAMHDRIEAEYNFDLSVTGFTAIGIDVSEKLGAALLPFGIVV